MHCQQLNLNFFWLFKTSFLLWDWLLECNLKTLLNYVTSSLVLSNRSRRHGMRYFLLETCNTTVSMRKATTCRIESHIRHIVYRIFTVYDSRRNVIYRGITADISVVEGRILLHTVLLHYFRFSHEIDLYTFFNPQESWWEALGVLA